MKHLRQLIFIILAGVGVGCLISAGIIYLDGRKEDIQSDHILDAFRPDLQETESGQTGTEPGEAPNSNNTFEESQEIPNPTAGSSSNPQDTESTEPTEEAPPPVDNPYADSYLANDDMAAWLQIPDTVIDYPVMWTPKDENYYLYRGFDKLKNQNGCLILDTDSSLDPLTTNLIIHGHNMKSGAMFGNLTDYADKDYYEKHKQIILYTPERQRNYEVIAVFRSQVYKKSDTVFKFYKFFQADTEEEFLDFYNNIKKLSLYDTGVTAEFGDHFITLSTCVYHVTNGRFVVVAKEVEGGDTYLPLE